VKTATISDFRSHPDTYLEAAEKGERIQVLGNGRPIFELVPATTDASRPSWKQAGPRLKLEGTSLSEQILNEREETDP